MAKVEAPYIFSMRSSFGHFVVRFTLFRRPLAMVYYSHTCIYNHRSTT